MTTPRPMIGGLCLRLAERYDVEVTLLRLAFVVLGLCWGVGVLIYGGLWFKVAGGDARAVLRGRAQDVRRRATAALGALRGGRWREHLVGRAPGVVLILFGAVILLWSFGLLEWLTLTRALALAAVALGLGSVIGSAQRHGETR